MKATIELNATQVVALYEMCEFCSTVIHRQYDGQDLGHTPESFGVVMSIQSKLDGCEDLDSHEPSLLDIAGVEVTDKKLFTILPELGVAMAALGERGSAS